MLVVPLSEVEAQKWEDACKAELERFEKTDRNPMMMPFWSASMQFDCFNDWWKRRREHIRRFTKNYWSERGYEVDWESSNSSLCLVPAATS